MTEPHSDAYTPLSAGETREPRIAIIGAGIAGLAAAGELRAAGLDVRVFDKSRGPGGRTATRRVESGTFDHGAQYFTARTPAFRSQLVRWQEQGLVAPWPLNAFDLHPDGRRDRLESGRERFVGVPRMSALARSLTENINVGYATRIARLELHDKHVAPLDDNDHPVGNFDAAIVTLPVAQSAALLATAQLELPAALRTLAAQPCWAVLLTLPRCEPQFDALRLRDDPMLAWLAHDSGKPGRTTQSDVSHFVAHATAHWSECNRDAEPKDVAATFAEQIATRLPELPGTIRAVAHRWLYARVAASGTPDPGASHALADDRVWLAGDGTRGRSRVEDAWLSGHSTARQLIEAFGR